VDAFLENAQRIFDVARSDDSAEPNEFALLIRPDGGLHFVMEPPGGRATTLESPAVHDGARIAYHVTRTTGGGVRVIGRSGNRECVLQQHAPRHSESANRFTAELLRDQPLYRISSPLTLCASSSLV
jgi:hypothetical protein